MRGSTKALVAAAALVPAAAWAHPGAPPAPHDVWTHWGAPPLELLLTTAPAAWYALGVRALWREAGRGRGVPRWRVVAFGGAVLSLLLALASPLDAIAEALFSAHMVQHLLLIVVAAPLAVLGAPLVPMLWALPAPARRAVGRWWRRRTTTRSALRGFSGLPLAFVLHTAALWLWHAPAPYQAALRHPVVHALEHLSFFGTALLFWWGVARPAPGRHAAPLLGLLAIAATLAQCGALGALLTFARAPWYPEHGAGARAWGITLLQDQQLAGLLMWVPAGFVYLVAAGALLVRSLGSQERASRRDCRGQTKCRPPARSRPSLRR